MMDLSSQVDFDYALVPRPDMLRFLLFVVGSSGIDFVSDTNERAMISLTLVDLVGFHRR